MKKSVYLKAFQSVVEDLLKKYSLVDFGFDWLRFKSSVISSSIEDYFNRFNSTTWPDIFVNNEFFNSITLGRSSVWPALFFHKKIELKNWITETFTILRIVKNEKNNSYLLDFYWLFFWLSKNYQNQILSIQDYLDYFGFSEFSVSRVDFNYNFRFSGDYFKLHTSILDDFKIKNYVDYKADSFAYWLFEKKWKDSSGKAIYRLTKSFGFRIYNKTKNIVDLSLQQVYPQYLDDTIRVELVCGSDTISWYFNSFDEFQLYFLSALSVGWLSVEKRKLRKIEKNSLVVSSDLKRKKLDLQARFYNYVKAGWKLRDIIQQYVIDNDYIDYLLNSNYLKAFALIESKIDKKLENSNEKTKHQLLRLKQKLFEIKVLLLNIDNAN